MVSSSSSSSSLLFYLVNGQIQSFRNIIYDNTCLVSRMPRLLVLLVLFLLVRSGKKDEERATWTVDDRF